MLDLFKRKKPPSSSVVSSTDSDSELTLLARFKAGLHKTRQTFAGGIARVFLGKKVIDEALFEELETLLLTSDVGVEATHQIIQDLTKQVKRNALQDSGILGQTLKEELIQLLTENHTQIPLSIPTSIKPFVILMVGVNGTGKTTTIG